MQGHVITSSKVGNSRRRLRGFYQTTIIHDHNPINTKSFILFPKLPFNLTQLLEKSQAREVHHGFICRFTTSNQGLLPSNTSSIQANKFDVQVLPTGKILS
jgi:hypothetical protein